MDTKIRYFAALNLSRSVPPCVKECRVIVTKVSLHPLLTDPTPTLPKLTASIDDLDDAEQAAHNGTPAATAVRDGRLLIVRSGMRQLKGYVQAVADQNLGDSKQIILGSGMDVIERIMPFKPTFAIKYGKIPSTAALFVRATKGRASYDWQMSTDLLTWLDLPRTLVASTEVDGLVAGRVYYFRYRTLTVNGLSAWSMPESFLAH
jgi:hypothetical protein